VPAETAAYVTALEAMLRAKTTSPTVLVELLRLMAWAHERCSLWCADQKQRDRAEYFFVAAAAIRERADRLGGEG